MIDIPRSNMHDSKQTDEEIIKQVYAFAFNLLFVEKQGRQIVTDALIQNGIDPKSAKAIVDNLISTHNERAKKNMLYGTLWCGGGVIATIADIGYIFWGAIVFGAIQFFKGLINLR